MSVQQGRIGGPLLANNLLRNGSNLAFDNKVLYVDVVNKRIGANNNAPVNDLYTPNAIDSVNLIVDTTADIGNFVVSGSTIQQVLTTVTIAPSALAGTAYISTPGLSTSNLYAYGNTLSDTVLNDSINITPNGTGSINFTNGNGSVQVTVNGGLHATGNITWDGNVTLGDQVTDLITFSADVNSNILPSTTYTYNLGSNSLLWNNIYTNTYSATTFGSTANTILNATTLNGGNIALTTNTIANSAGNDISFITSGTGAVNFDGSYYFNTANTITFPSAIVTFNNINNGYMQFTGNNGVVFPAGTSSNYPPSPVQGQLRYNSTLGYSEVYNGTSWNPVGGTSAVLTQNQVNDVMWAWDLILG